MRARWLALVLLCAGATTFAPRATAAETVVVAVVRPLHGDPIVEEAAVRLAGELRAVGCSVRFIKGTPGADGRAQVEGGAADAAGDGLFATIAILGTERGARADVWVADHITHKTLVRRVELGDPGATNGASDLAVRAAELLRASLLEVGGELKRDLPVELARWIEESAPSSLPSPPSPSSLPSPPLVGSAPAVLPARASPVRGKSSRSAVPEPRARKAAPAPAAEGVALLEAGFAPLASDVGLVPGAFFRVDYRLPASFFVRASLVQALASAFVEAQAGRVALGQTAGVIDLIYAPPTVTERLHPVLGLGAGLYHLTVDGSAKLPYRSEHHDFATVVLAAEGGLAVHLTSHLDAVAAFDLLVLLTTPTIRIAGAGVRHTGRAVYVPSIGLKLSL